MQDPKDWKNFYSNMDKDRPIEEVCALLKSLLKDDANQIIFVPVGLRTTGKKQLNR